MSTTATAAFGIQEELTIEAQIAKQIHPHRDEGILRELYEERGLSLQQCADRLGCSQTAVRYWMEKYGVERRDATEAARDARRVERASFGHSGAGYEQWQVRDSDGNTTVCVHQLTAIADGADPAEVFGDGTHTHHRNGIPWDNRPDNLEIVTLSQHKKSHLEDSRQYDDELGCEVLVTADAAEAGGA